MDLSLNQEQSLLQDSIQKFIEDNYALSERRKFSALPEGFSRDNWSQFAELGWLAIPFSEEDGGFGGTPIETMILMEEFGKGLVVEPYLPTVVLVGTALRTAGSAEQRTEILPGIIDGSTIATFAHEETQSHFDHANVVTKAQQEGEGFVLSGTKSLVWYGDAADRILVSTRTAGGDRDPDGITLFLLDATAEGITRKGYPTVDGLHAAEITFENVHATADQIIGKLNEGLGVIETMVNHAILALGAEAVGAMEVLYKNTIDYTRQRVQFDHPLSDFQVLQHRMTEMFMEYHLAKSLCMKATMLTAQGSPEAQRTIHALKVMIGNAGRFIGQNAVQLHGGMGMTEELAIAHYFKRLTVIDSQFGNVDYHLTKFVDL